MNREQRRSADKRVQKVNHKFGTSLEECHVDKLALKPDTLRRVWRSKHLIVMEHVSC